MATVSETIQYLFTDDGSLEKLKKRLKSLGKESDDTKDEIRDLKVEIERLEKVERRAAKATRQLHGTVRAVEAGGRAFGGRIGELAGIVGDFEGVVAGTATAVGPAGLLGAMALLAGVAVPVGVVRTVGALIDLSRAAVDARDTLEDLGGITLVSSAGLAAVDDLEDAIDNLDRQFSRLVVELSPALISTVDLLADGVSRMGDGAERFAAAFSGVDAEALAGLLGSAAGTYAGATLGPVATRTMGSLGSAAVGALGLGGRGRSGVDDFVGPIDDPAFRADQDRALSSVRFNTGAEFKMLAESLGMISGKPGKTDEQIAAGVRFSTGPEFKLYTENTRALESLRAEAEDLGAEFARIDFSGLPTAEDFQAATQAAAGAVLSRYAGEAGGRELGREVVGKVLSTIPIFGKFLEQSVAFLADLPAFFDGLINELTTLPVKIVNGLAEVIATVPAKLISSLPDLIAGSIEGVLKLLLSPTALFSNLIKALGQLPKQFVKAFTGLPVRLLQFVDPEENGLFRGPQGRVLGIPGTEKRAERVPVGRDVRNLPEADVQASSRGGSAVFIGGWSEAVDALDIQQRQRRSFGGGNVGP